jgi:hypothetical protein
MGKKMNENKKGERKWWRAGRREAITCERRRRIRCERKRIIREKKGEEIFLLLCLLHAFTVSDYYSTKTDSS